MNVLIDFKKAILSFSVFALLFAVFFSSVLAVTV